MLEEDPLVIFTLVLVPMVKRYVVDDVGAAAAFVVLFLRHFLRELFCVAHGLICNYFDA